MNYELILNDLKPSQEEIDAVNKTTEKVVDFLNKTCIEEGIDAEAMAVGSVAKNTWLSGKSDIDIFIHFHIDTDMDVLKEKGMELAYKTNNAFNGKASEHYASHPYLTCDIDGFEVDIVPCYRIEEGDSIISAVDRTILHTKYIQKHLDEEQEGEVLLLKKFMDAIGTYGSEFKTGGFAGYLCELLILNYGTFEDTLRNAQDWKFHTMIDLEDYGTAKNKLFYKYRAWDEANRYARFGMWSTAPDCDFYSWRSTYRYLCGLSLNFCSSGDYRELKSSEEVKKMPVYPEQGSIKKIGDFIVVKVSDKY